MAKAIYEKRVFHNKQTGEDVSYEVYGIVAIVEGERMELALKSLSPAEKIAFKMVMTGSDPEDISLTSRKATDEEKDGFLKQFDDDESSELDLED